MLRSRRSARMARSTGIGELTGWCHDRGLDVLVEVHSNYLHQLEIAQQVDYVYDFALPPLVLYALTAADAGPLLAWLAIRPTNAVTVPDTHDGIGVIDVGPGDADQARPGLMLAGTYAWRPGSSGADRLSTAPATAGDAQNFASSARSRTATCDSVSSPVRSTSPVTKTIRGPTTSSRR